MDELLADFVAETKEMLEASEGELIAWEANPADRARLDAIFRFVHTVKGNCGFFDFPRLEALSHAAEDALAEVRAGRRAPDAALVTAVLSIIDRISQMADAIEAGEDFPEGGDEALIAALDPNDEDGGVEIAAEQAGAPKTGAAKTDGTTATPRTIRLPVDLLDRVMSGVSDMVLARNDLAHRLRESGNEPTIDGPFERLTTILKDVRDAVTRMRMQRVEHLFGAFPRLVRDLSAELGKQVMIDIEGGDVELDREMIEMIRDPMTHIIRNAIGHGIEAPSERLKDGKREIGLLSIAARQSGDKIWIVVGDDGRGLNQEKIGAKAVANGLISEAELKGMNRDEVLQLIFEPGLSTAEEVNSISGRGVGLDVVRSNIERIGGEISVRSTPSEGSMFVLKIPLTLSIIAGLTMQVGSQRFAISQSFVEEIVHTRADTVEFSDAGGARLVTFRGRRTPCLSLAEVLDIQDSAPTGRNVLVFVRLASGDVIALEVDGIHNYGDLVVKPLPPTLVRLGIFAGSTLLDDGRPILMLDIPTIAAQYGLLSDTRTRVPQLDIEASEESARKAAAMRAMLFTARDGRRKAIRLELVQRIDSVMADAIDMSSDTTRVAIDGEILPLLGLAHGEEPEGIIRLLRLSDGGCDLLYAVKEIRDAVDLDQDLVEVEDDPLVEAVTLIGDEQVKLIDGHALFARYGKVKAPRETLTCRVPSGEWSDAILTPLLRTAGYTIVREEDADADISITLDEGDESAKQAQDAARLLRLRSLPDSDVGEDERARSIYRYDREAVLSALRRFRKGEAA